MKRKLLYTLLPVWMLASVAMSAQQPAVVATCAAEPASDEVSIVDNINSPGNSISVEAPENLLKRAEKVAAGETEAQTPDDENGEEQETEEGKARTKGGKTVGYRVQVFAVNSVRSAKTEARQRERAVGQAFPAYSTYVSYASPYWRLRVGDFRSQYDAEKAAAEIRRAFPRYSREVRVVRDRVNVR